MTHSSSTNILRIGLFFDGTGNNLTNALAGTGGVSARAPSGSYANAPSNIALLYGLYPDAADLHPGVHCLSLYVEGIGTRQGAPDSMLSQATGLGATGVEARVEQAMQWLREQVARWRQQHPQPPLQGVEVDLFGFSRGAAAARHCANRLVAGEVGSDLAVTLNFIGLFDTVAAIFDPMAHPSPGMQFGTLRLGLADGIARKVVQLAAADEFRQHFALVASGNDCLLPGAHSDIGGGYPAQVREQVLLCKPFSCRVPASNRPEATAAYAQAAQWLDEHSPRAAGQLQLHTWEVLDEDHRARREAPYKRVFATVSQTREVPGQLSQVYLSIMRELAVQHGVPLAPLPGEWLAQLPSQLQPISQALHAYALGHSAELHLTAGQREVLQRYIHTSAHWNPAAELRDASPDVLFVNRPTADGVRLVHANPLG
ncbi:T6SS phospholipase effector Tle1-like catalytic domain-containing protein [Pseudomonas cremoricolorata]|uniref:T6SS Phospholipase effector Tle1-like catalytic domain-containing protein n=1 Tax=Pseudomonas cremoricolorata TaxID=157783 RepID=A0A089YIE8_9PSED|nr:DUF2235 domain-containing protein [Pseudomonas cremoricolorata]AIR91473.1 hypothetical protein LK03_20340 [Pseudomonas cremoricolorata]